MFDYTISKNADEIKFNDACKKILQMFPNIEQDKLLVDVDGSKIQMFSCEKGKIKLINDYEVDAVYIESEFDLREVFHS